MRRPRSARRWPLAAVLTWSFAALIVLAVGAVLLVAVTSGANTARSLLAQKAQLLVSTISARVRERVLAVSEQATFMATQLQTDPPRAGEERRVLAALRSSLAAAPQLAGTVVFTPERLALEAYRTPTGMQLRARDRSDEPELAAIMREIERATQGYWGDPVYVERFASTIINYRVPMRRGGRFVGALASSLTTAELSQFLTHIARPHGATAFILLGPEELLAYADLAVNRLSRSEERPLPSIDDAPGPVLRYLWDETRSRRLDISDELPGYEVRQVTVGDEDYVLVFELLEGITPIPWIVGCSFRLDELASSLHRIRVAALTGLGVLLLAVVAVYAVGRWLSRPILGLAEAATTVGRDGPSGAPRLPGSRLRELDLAAAGFNEMVAGLRERQKLRETFGKYVPDSVADAIVADDGILRPQSRVTTTLFTDIAGFSTVAERMSPEALLAMLGEYFSAIVEPIEAHGGVIHQFQGDAILATYNLPVPHADHAARAVRSALAIQALVERERFGGGHRLTTRVGINTGEAVCGTVGGAGRLGFTVHGDEVNLAARVEQMNKSLGTLVLVAESTVRLAGDEFRFERVGELPVRGRRADVVVYRVAGVHTPRETWSPR